MRWRVTWLCIVLAMVTGGQHMTIDRDIHAPGTGSTPEGVVVVPAPEGPTPEFGGGAPKPEGFASESEAVASETEESTPENEVAVPEPGGSTPESVVVAPEPELSRSSRTSNNKECTESLDECEDEGTGENGNESEGEIFSEEEEKQKEKIVNTDRGQVQGFYKHDGYDIVSFYDIPYGEFEEPFAAPIRAPRWIGLHAENEHRKRCPQLDESDTYHGEEDCLTLSIFVPENVVEADVLFHIYDSNFISGSADPTIYGPEYLVTKDVILVLPNYRLGPLGFLCLQNDLAPGNAALKDLTLALSWTNRNIRQFGGNPDNIVVSGDGTAGALVGYLALSSQSRDYIKGAIIDSGSVLSHWAIDRDPIATATELAKKLNDQSSESEETLDIFKNINIENLVKAADNIKFKPCIESNVSDAFINETPWKILQETKINISFIVGSANHAGMHEAVDHTSETIEQLNQNFSLFLPNDLKFEKTEDKSEASKRLKEQYFGEDTISLSDKVKLSHWHTDASYLGPIIRAARALVDTGATIYFYEFSYLGGLNREHDSLGKPLDGAARGDILGYIFCQGGQLPEDSNDEDMVELMTNLWVHFMKEGKPPENLGWNELQKTNDSQEYWLSIKGPEVTTEQGVHVSRLRLWTEMYNDHFVDRSWATGLCPSCYPVFITLLFYGFCKFF